MRTSVDAEVATASHAAAVAEVMDEFEPPLVRALDRVLRRYVRHAIGVFERAQTITVVGAAELPSWRVPLPGDLVDEDAAMRDLQAANEPIRDNAIKRVSGRMALDMGIAFDQSNRLLDGVIKGQAGRLVTTAPEELVADLMGSLQESYDKGAPIPQAARAMRKLGYTRARGYAERIARTELVGASNAASLAQVRGATLIEYKMWMSTGDTRTRPSHRDAEGQTVRIDERFTIGQSRMDYPGDPAGSPDEVIQCRCTLGYADAANVATIAGGQRMATVEDTETAPTVGAGWAAVIAQEGVDTGDLRRIEPGALNWRALPLTMMSQLVTPEFGGHTDAAVAGRIDDVSRDGANINATGVFDVGTHGAETERMVREQMLRGVSVDLAINDAEIIPDPDIEDEIEAWFMGTLNVLDGTILGATIVPFPAFENASIAIVAGAAMRMRNPRREMIDGERKQVVSFFMPFTPDFADAPVVEDAPAGGGGAPDAQAALDDAMSAAENAIVALRDAVDAMGSA